MSLESQKRRKKQAEKVLKKSWLKIFQIRQENHLGDQLYGGLLFYFVLCMLAKFHDIQSFKKEKEFEGE